LTEKTGQLPPENLLTWLFTCLEIAV